MGRGIVSGFLSAVLFCAAGGGARAESAPLDPSRDTLRVEVSVEMEPLHLDGLGIDSPIDSKTAKLWALEDSAALFSALVYGWDFEYEPGEIARQHGEYLSLKALGSIEPDDRRIRASAGEVRDSVFYMWCDYLLVGDQQRRLKTWRASHTKELKALGFAPLKGKEGVETRAAIKFAALEDAIKKALRAELRKTMRKRPRLVKGSIALADYPLYRMFHGNWAAQASFRIFWTEAVPYSAY